jgi:hypothetical protein
MMPPTSDIRIPAQRQPGHQPWCGNHIPGMDDGDFGTCMSADIVLPGQIVALAWQPGEPVQVNLCTGDHVEVVTVAEVKRRATAMLAQVAVAEAYAVVTV